MTLSLESVDTFYVWVLIEQFSLMSLTFLDNEGDLNFNFFQYSGFSEKERRPSRFGINSHLKQNPVL